MEFPHKETLNFLLAPEAYSVSGKVSGIVRPEVMAIRVAEIYTPVWKYKEETLVHHYTTSNERVSVSVEAAVASSSFNTNLP